MIQIYHEAPLSIFEKVQATTDGDYALVHLLEQDEDYAAKFTSQLRYNPLRPTILDNSAYELGKAFDPDLFALWINKLRPEIYVVPDTIGDMTATTDAFSDWCKHCKNFPGKKMGVLQGNTPDEAVRCFKDLSNLGADIIGIPFLIGKSFAKGAKMTNPELLNQRVQLIRRIRGECKIKPIHLLGVALPQEGFHHKANPWIMSIDTSNPVVHGMFGIRYTDQGLDHKVSTLLADLIHKPVSPHHEEVIFFNIGQFRRIWI